MFRTGGTQGAAHGFTGLTLEPGNATMHGCTEHAPVAKGVDPAVLGWEGAEPATPGWAVPPEDIAARGCAGGAVEEGDGATGSKARSAS